MKAMLVASSLLLSIQVARADDLLMAKSNHPVMETLDRVEAAAKSAGFFIVARVDHAGAAEGVGLKLRPTALLIFGKPQGGTPLMQCDQRAGIDLPLKALAWQDESGQVWLGMVDPAVLKSRYGLGAVCDAPIAAMQGGGHGLLGAVRHSGPQQADAPASAWTGGHGTVPNEQKTQQSPLFGFSFTPQPEQV